MSAPIGELRETIVQGELWPAIAQRERLHRAILKADTRALYLARQTWPMLKGEALAQISYIVVSSLAEFVTDIQSSE